MFGSGKDLIESMEKLAKTSLLCPKCGEFFTFDDGLIRAKKNGIQDNVLMCGKCHSIYSSDGVLSSKKLTIDVTDKYTSLIQNNPSVYVPLQLVTASVPASSSKKSPLLAAVLSFFLFGGIGQIYLGQWKKGLTLIFTNFLLNSFLILMPISIPIISILGVGDAYGTAQKMGEGSSTGEWKFNINWKAAGIALLIYGVREIIFLAIRKSSG